MRQFIFSSGHLQKWSGSFYLFDAVLLHRMMCLSREMFYLDLLGRCMDIWGAATCLYHSTPIPKIPVGSVWQRRHPRRLFWQVHVSWVRFKKWLNGYWRNWFGLLRKGNDMGWVMMMRVISSTPLAVVTPDWAHTYFWAFFILFSRAFGRLTISSRRHKVKELKYYIILLCHGAPIWS